MKHFFCVAVVLFSFVGYQQAAEVLPIVLKGHTDAIYSAAWSPDGKKVVTTGGDQDGTVRIWDAETGKEKILVEHDNGRRMGIVACAIFSPDGKRFLSAGTDDTTVRIWDTETGKQLHRMDAGPRNIWYANISPDGTKVIVPSGNIVRIWDFETGKQLQKLEVREGLSQDEFSFVRAVFLPDGEKVVTLSYDKTTRIWDAESGEELYKFVSVNSHDPISPPPFSPDGKKIVLIYPDKNLWICDIETGKELLVLEGIRECYAFSPCGKKIAARDSDGHVLLLDSVSGKVLLRLGGGTQLGRHLAFSPDSTRIAVSTDNTVMIFETESGKELQTLQYDSRRSNVSPGLYTFASIVFSPDGKKIFSGNTAAVYIWALE